MHFHIKVLHTRLQEITHMILMSFLLLCHLGAVQASSSKHNHSDHKTNERTELHHHGLGSHTHKIFGNGAHNHIDRNDTFKLVDGKPPKPAEGSWTVVVVPDTQCYTKVAKISNEKGGKSKKNKRRKANNLEILNKMFIWMEEDKEKRNIEMVLHVGDMTSSNQAEEWTAIRKSYSKLDKRIPYVVCVGNHDTKPIENNALLNNYFKIEQNPLNEKIFKGSYTEGKLENAYYTMQKNGQNFLYIALEYGPRQVVVDWADKIIKQHRDHHVFIVVHEYLTEKSRMMRNDGVSVPEKEHRDKQQSKHRKEGHEINFGHDLHRKLFENNPNVEFLVGGHYGCVVFNQQGELVHDRQELATAHSSLAKDQGLTFHSILFNAQWISNGGDGWLLLLEFQPDNKTVKAWTYSPYLDAYRVGSEYSYILNRTLKLSETR